MSAGERLPERYRCLEVLRDDELEFLVRADDTVLHREVLIKAPGPGLLRHLLGANDRDRVMREARALAKLRHDNAVKLLDVVEQNGTPLLVLEPVVGETLAERVARSGPLSPSQVVRLGKQLASALAAIHAAGAVHRSIAPENIVLGHDDTPVLVGFGLAKFASKTGASSIYYQGAVGEGAPEFAVPLPRYPAPEQMLGTAADARTDLFSLGSTLEFALLGRDPPPQRAHDASRSRENSPLREILARCTARSALQRYQSAPQLETALASLPEPSEATASATPSPATRTKSSPRLAQLSGLAAVLIVAVAVPTLLNRGDRPAASGESETERGAPRLLSQPIASTGLAARYDRSVALVIGIGTYAEAGFEPLPNAEKDARAVAEKLNSMKEWERWDVRTLFGAEATKTRIEEELARLQDDAAGKDDRVFVYYAGHGERSRDDAKRGWIIPADAKPSKSAIDRIGWIDYDAVNAVASQIKAKHFLLMLDCCFGGVAATRFRGTSNAAVDLLEPVKMVIASGRPSERVPDGEKDGHSPFVTAFLKILESDRSEIAATTLSALLKEESPKYGGTGVTHGYFENSGSGDFTFFLKPPGK